MLQREKLTMTSFVRGREQRKVEMVRKSRLKELQKTRQPISAHLARLIIDYRPVLKTQKNLQEMSINTLNECQALKIARSHLEEIERLPTKAFSVSDMPQYLFDKETLTLIEIRHNSSYRPIHLGDSDEDMGGNGEIEDKEGVESDSMSVPSQTYQNFP